MILLTLFWCFFSSLLLLCRFFHAEWRRSGASSPSITLCDAYSAIGMVGLCKFLEHFVNFVILRIPFADSSPSLFMRELVSSMASLCCSCLLEALPVFRLLMNRNFSCIVKTLVDAYIVVARDLVGTRLICCANCVMTSFWSLCSFLTCIHLFNAERRSFLNPHVCWQETYSLLPMISLRCVVLQMTLTCILVHYRTGAFITVSKGKILFLRKLLQV